MVTEFYEYQTNNMKISIITPSHNTRHLRELEHSILSNSYQNWEWVILLNGGASDYIVSDERIKVHRSKQTGVSVGAYKKEACDLTTGEAIIEADHDDLLTPDCIEEVAKAFEDKEVGFVYSDDAKLSDNFKPYGAQYGWTYRMFNWKGRDLYAMRTMPQTPANIGYIWYAPDHVRAWRKSTYDLVGGHIDSKELCDDLDLMQRLYMVCKFKHIEKVLYIYRIDGTNTWLDSENNKAIQKRTVELYRQRIQSLACRYADLNKALKIDLCGGFGKPEGFTSIDIKHGDITADLEKGIPLGDNTVGVIRANDALEHIKNSQQLMNEIYRVLIPGGILLSSTPSTDGRGAFQDPTHVSFWNQNSFWYYTREAQAQYIGQTNLFRECALYTHFPSDWHKQHNIPYTVAHLEKPIY